MSKQKNKSYRLTDDRSGEAFLLKVGRDRNLTIFDSKDGVRKSIRHCPNEKSIFVDEQSKYALVETIIFEQGYLEVPFDQPLTQQFLSSHPDNVSNGGSWFEEVNEELEANTYVEEEDLKHKIRNTILEKAEEKDGINAIEMVAAVLAGSLDNVSGKKLSELKRDIYIEIENNPRYFLNEKDEVDIFDDEATQRKYIVLRAIKDGIIYKSINGKSMHWTKTDKKIVTAPVGVELVEYFADFLSTDEGILVTEEISNRS